MEKPTVRRPNWRRGFWISFEGIRDQLQKERANVSDRRVRLRGRLRRISMMSSKDIDDYAHQEATRRAEQSIRLWNEREASRKLAMGEGF